MPDLEPEFSDSPLRWLIPSLAIALAYFGSLCLIPKTGFWINDNGCKFIQAQALLKNAGRDASVPWPGQAVDPTFRFNPLPFPYGQVYHGQLYGFYSNAFARLSASSYRAWGFPGLYVLPLLGPFLALPALWRIAGLLPCSRLGQPLSLLIASLATPLWFYSVSFWEHTTALALVLWAAYYGLLFMAGFKTSNLLKAMVLCSLAIYFRDELYLWAGLLGLLCLIRRPSQWQAFLWAGCLSCLVLCPLWISQWRITGNPLGHHVASLSPAQEGLRMFLSERWTSFQTLFLNGHKNPWLSALACGPFALLFLLRPQLPIRPWVLGLGFALSLVQVAIVALGFATSSSPISWTMKANGLFVACPVLILALVRWRGREQESAFSAQPDLFRLALGYALVFAALAPAVRVIGIHWGCRHILLVIPLLACLAASSAGQVWERAPRAFAIACLLALGCLSVAGQVYSLHLLQARQGFCSRLNRIVWERPEQAIVTRDWFLPQELAPVFFDKMVFLVQDQGQEKDLFELLRSKGISSCLFVSSVRGPGGMLPGGEQVLDPLNFMSVSLRQVDLYTTP